MLRWKEYPIKSGAEEAKRGSRRHVQGKGPRKEDREEINR